MISLPRAEHILSVLLGIASIGEVSADTLHFPGIVRITANLDNIQDHGTGCLIDGGLVLTASHVVSGGGSISCRITGRDIPGTIIYSGRRFDVAVIKLSEAEKTVPFQFATRSPTLGDKLTFLGHGTGQLNPITGPLVGHVSGSKTGDLDTMRIKGAARQGDSGAPILNSDGELVGILWGSDGLDYYGTPLSYILLILHRLHLEGKIKNSVDK